MNTTQAVDGVQRAADRYAAHFTTAPGYLDFAHFGPPSVDVLNAVTGLTRAAMSGAPLDAVDVLTAAQTARSCVADLLGTPLEQVTLTPNTSTALFQAAYALPPGGVVLAPAEDFPSNTRPWQRAAERGGPQLRLVPSTAASEVTDHLISDVTAVTISAVDYRTGARADLARLREVIGDRLLIVDGIQGFGVIDADWACADVLAVGAQKWLRAGWGCGFMACSTRALERLGHGLSGWTGVPQPLLGAHEQTPVPTADRFTITNPSPQAAAGLTAALRVVAEAGVPAIDAAVTERASALIEVLTAAGGVLLGPTDPAFRAGIVSARFPHGPDPALIAAAFARAELVATRRGDYLRMSVHASTPHETIDDVAAALVDAEHAPDR